MRNIIVLINTISMMVALIYCFSTNAQLAPSCNALVEVKNDLWLATQNGELQKQLTYDGKLKYAVTVAPNGKVIGFSGEQSGDGVTLIDSNGTHLADVNPNVEDAITSLAWTSSDTLKIGQHVSPNASKFFYMRVPTNPFSTHFSEIHSPTVGNDCATSPDGKYIACFLGGTLNVNDRDLYSLTDPFIAAEKLESLNLAVGSTALTSTTPVFQIQILGINKGYVHLKVSSASEEWQEYFQKNGDIAELTYFIDSNDSNQVLPLLGLQSDFDNPNAKTALLTVVKSLKGGVSFEASPVWDPSGKRVAFIEKNDLDERVLVFINRQTKDPIDGRIVLPPQTPVTALTFMSDTHLVIQSGNGNQLVLDIPAQGKLPNTASFLVRPSLPLELNITNQFSRGVYPVKGWICQ